MAETQKWIWRTLHCRSRHVVEYSLEWGRQRVCCGSHSDSWW